MAREKNGRKEGRKVAVSTSSNSSDYWQVKRAVSSGERTYSLAPQRFSNFREPNETCCDKSDAVGEYRRERQGDQRWKQVARARMKERTDGKGRVEKIGLARAVGERTRSKVYHYFVLVHRKTPRLRLVSDTRQLISF